MKVEEVVPESGDNTARADSADALRAYYARKRTISVRSSLLLAPFVVSAALVQPILGLALGLGGICGVTNMWLVMRNNERLLAGTRSRGAHGANNLVRIVAVGAIPALLAAHGPWWSMGLYFAGFFTPLALYAGAAARAER